MTMPVNLEGRVAMSRARSQAMWIAAAAAP